MSCCSLLHGKHTSFLTVCNDFPVYVTVVWRQKVCIENLTLLCSRTDSRSPLSGHRLHEEDAGLIAPVRTTSNVYAESPLQSQKSALANPYLSPARTVSYVPTTPLGKQVAASADAIRRRLLQTPASEARHAASQLESAKSVL